MIKLKIVDFRSDTVTKPSEEMWEVLRSLDDSKIGDDVEGEDPTVNELEEKAAEVIGKLLLDQKNLSQMLGDIEKCLVEACVKLE